MKIRFRGCLPWKRTLMGLVMEPGTLLSPVQAVARMLGHYRPKG